MNLNKYAAVIVSVITAASSCMITGNAVSDTDIAGLKKVIAGENKIDLSYDFDNNGDIDIFDLVKMKNYIINENNSGGETVNYEYSASEKYVKFVGRYFTDKNNTAWLVQSGSAVEFTISGVSAEITVAGDSMVDSEEKYRPRYAVYVDGELIEDSILSTYEKTIKLFDGDTPRKADVKIIHLSEANNGAVGIKNISVSSSSANPVVPAAEKNLKIEFIGDSITCAYGVEAKSQNDPYSTSTENFMKSYAYLTAEKLDADYSAVSYSGHGVISGYTSSERNTESLVPDCYEFVGKLPDYMQKWDFEKHQNDVVVINLGTNDYSYLKNDLENLSDDFVKGYTDFLKMVRSKNPDAYIICTMGTMGGEDIYPLIEKAVENFRSENDDRIMCYLSAVQKTANGYGADWHPSEITQQQIAYVLADKICEALGMESDKVGLDFAENGKYDVVINSDSGANAAFYVGYDKSFWINMVMGGEKTSDIQAYVGEMNLMSGKYRLEFDYTTGLTKEIPVYVKQHGSDSCYLSDTVNSDTSTAHYSKEFTVDSSAENCKIVFELGKDNYYNATFSNITLVKIS